MVLAVLRRTAKVRYVVGAVSVLALLGAGSAATASAGGDSPGGGGCGQASPIEPGTSGVQTIVSGGQSRAYRLHVPPGYRPWTRLPVVLVLHGGYSRPADFDAEMEVLTGFSRQADRETFIAVYPRATTTGLGETRWNTGSERDPTVDDVAFIGDVIDHVSAIACVDERRVYATGFSSGGGMTGILACRMAGRLAAVAAVSGAFFLTERPCSPARPIPILEFHGTSDKVPYQGGQVGTTDMLPPIPQWLQDWADRNRCQRGPITFFTDNDVTGERWIGCHAGATVVHYRIQDGLHAWPGFPPGTMTIDATSLIWRFFAPYATPRP